MAATYSRELPRYEGKARRVLTADEFSAMAPRPAIAYVVGEKQLQGVHDDPTGVTLEEVKAKAIACGLGPHRAAVLRRHGVVTVRQTVDEAA